MTHIPLPFSSFSIQTTMGTLNMFTIPKSHTTQTTSTFPYQPETHHALSCRSLKLRQRLQWQKLVVVQCGGGDRPEVKLQKDEKKREDSDEMELDNVEDVNEKVELMEMEAIMGKDDGREAMDYKRRAGIFYKSSEVFQANKDRQHHHCT
ncbi:hypothetical protein HanRHA438_Chr14g0679461 [Helianthus annuus]|nr:hypothetical protein HanIR_Chr14g0725031 [Helianthus annuus]KAJ0856000.1 hypothetical protein HanRHA438_Chr14g0679461 [Helianthus annuus]